MEQDTKKQNKQLNVKIQKKLINKLHKLGYSEEDILLIIEEIEEKK